MRQNLLLLDGILEISDDFPTIRGIYVDGAVGEPDQRG